MKTPLSYRTYFSGNKKSICRYIATVIFTAILLSVIQVILVNLNNEITYVDKMEKYVIDIRNENGELVSQELLSKVKAIEEVKYVIPKKSIPGSIVVFAAAPDSNLYYMQKEDIKKCLEALNIKYDKNVIDQLEEKQVYVSDRIRKNLDLNVGDEFSKDLDTKYKEEFKSDFLIGFTPVELNNVSDEYLIIPKKGQMKKVIKNLNKVLDDNVIIHSYGDINKLGVNNTIGTFNIVKLIIIITCSIATGVTTFLHYYNRRKEIGILKAIGFSDKKVLLRITKEILISSTIALIISAIMINGIVYFLNTFLAFPNGYLRFIFNISMMSDMVIVVLSIMIFSLVPTWILLKSIDKVALVEGR